ncbi:MAG: hypothetical protein IIZ46_06065, partial [Clostridia bacterium]|nr:hypothetical protein [Clostridia bacterium]
NTAYDDVDTDLDELFMNFSHKDRESRTSGYYCYKRSKDDDYDDYDDYEEADFNLVIAMSGASPFANCPELEYIEVDPQNKTFKSIDGVLFTKARYTEYETEDDSLLALIEYPQAMKCEDYTIPENVVSIGSGDGILSLLEDPYKEFAFYDCPDLNNVHMSDDVDFIREGEFGKCPNLTIYSSADSCAVDYAEYYGINNVITDPVLLGDVTGDNNVTVKDTLIIMRHVVGAAQLNDKQLPFADANKDKKVSAADAFIIQRFAVGYDMGYDIGKPID